MGTVSDTSTNINTGKPKLKIIPLELKELNALVAALHRHHKPVQGHRFSIGVQRVDTGVLVGGGASIGRPVARHTDPKSVLEITRLVTDGTPNACSALYSAAARVGRELGYAKIQTFIMDTEPGVSLRAAGWVFEGNSAGGYWIYTKNGVEMPRRRDQPICVKQRWVKLLNGN